MFVTVVLLLNFETTPANKFSKHSLLLPSPPQKKNTKTLFIYFFFLKVHYGAGIVVSWICCFYNMGWRGVDAVFGFSYLIIFSNGNYL